MVTMAAPAAGVDRPHRAADGPRAWPERHVDTGFTFVLFAATLFSLQIGGLVLIYAAAIGLFLTIRLRAAGPALVRCAPIFVLPAYALASTLWSVAPATTLYYGTEFLLTVLAAILIGAATCGQSALKGMFAAFFLWALLNLAAGILYGDFTRGYPFVGLAG
ncbi:MAG: O-Antigen ligase, partial [Sphingomonas bacterium]|nr:O-Antigen ligase [Sphingomonas bacterium]